MSMILHTFWLGIDVSTVNYTENQVKESKTIKPFRVSL